MSKGTAGFMNGPTPIDAAPRLAVDLGLDADDLLVKRDDLMGLGGGGNKVRKLQVTMGQALDAAADVVVTTGAAQSNHARLTAAAGARVGLPVVLVLQGHAPETERGNVLLDRLFGAEIIWSGHRPPEAVADEVEHDRSRGRVHRIPFGGSSPASAEAYVRAGEEVLDQVPDVRHVVVAVGSGGTMAGLVTAVGAERVLGVDTGAVPDARRTVHALMEGMRSGTQGAADSLRIDGGQVGQGYEHLAESTRAALSRAARTEGLILDPTYSGRAMAGLVSAVASGGIRPGDKTVFLHTGGLPGLFGHEAF
ncbi:pyridoxal-phosphate dependent enzyme [Aeromicrobium wangtongii]|uniref:pyridoxal-phosphate dependent enzyme n=1 Tax=Aeromicrobium wangtongii TaxID=2969247 RepID=UPI0020177D4F|nr:pyridoxal-phosphate dependent enzyme [Aeromicrobium wangtongii]MCL3819576.1 pyridoxal-phosphate dependent enzyme [Aeromicrobium wangtongii]